MRSLFALLLLLTACTPKSPTEGGEAEEGEGSGDDDDEESEGCGNFLSDSEELEACKGPPRLCGDVWIDIPEGTCMAHCPKCTNSADAGSGDDPGGAAGSGPSDGDPEPPLDASVPKDAAPPYDAGDAALDADLPLDADE